MYICVYILHILKSHINWSLPPFFYLISFNTPDHFLQPPHWPPIHSHTKFILPSRHLLLFIHLFELLTLWIILWLDPFSLFGSKFRDELFKSISPDRATLPSSHSFASYPIFSDFYFLHRSYHYLKFLFTYFVTVKCNVSFIVVFTVSGKYVA